MQTYYEENPARDASGPHRGGRQGFGADRYALLSEQRISALHPMSIFPFTGSCLPASIPTPDAYPGLQHHEEGMGAERSDRALRKRHGACGRRWIMTFSEEKKFSYRRAFRWMRSSSILRYLYPDCGRSTYLERATPERRRCSSSSICAHWALM